MTATGNLAIHRAVQEIIEMLHFATDKTKGTVFKSLKLNIKTTGMEEESEACLFHLKLHSSSANPEEFVSSLTQTQDSKLLSVLSAMQFTEDESHLCVQYLQAPSLMIQKSFQVRYNDDQSLLVLHCLNTSTKSSRIEEGVTLHLRILLSKTLMMLECQKMYKYLWLFKIFNPKMHLEFNMKIFENLCESDLSCTSINVSGSSLEICGDPSYFLRNTSYDCSAPCLVPVCSEVTPLRTDTSSQPYTVSLQVVAHMNYIHGRGIGKHRTCANKGLINLYLFGPDAVPIFPVLEDIDTKYNPLEQILWNVYGLNFYNSSVSVNDRFSSIFAALLESTVPQTQRKEDRKFILFIHVHFGVNSRTVQTKLELSMWLHNNYPSILKDHQQDIEKSISQVVGCLLKPHRETDKKTECYTKAIPNMVKSIAYILSHSGNEEFRQNCFSLLSINNSRDVESEVTDRLWDIASKRCGVRGHTGGREHSLTNHEEDSAELTNLEKDISTKGGLTDNRQEISKYGGCNGGQETFTGSCFVDGRQETTTSSYTDLAHELFTSLEQGQEFSTEVNFIGQRQKTSAEQVGFLDNRQKRLNSFTYLGNNDSRESGFINCRRQETSTEHIARSLTPQVQGAHVGSHFAGLEEMTRSGTGGHGQETSTECCVPEFVQENYTCWSHFADLEQEISAECDFADLGQETSAECAVTVPEEGRPTASRRMMHKSRLLELDNNSKQACRSLGTSNQHDWTEICGGSLWPSGDTVNHPGYPLYNINDITGSSQHNQSVINTDCLYDLINQSSDKLNFLPKQGGIQCSFQGDDYGSQDTDAGDSFDAVLEDVQQWLDEF